MEKTRDTMNAREWLDTFTAVYKNLMVCLSRNTKAGYNEDNWFVFASGSPWYTNELGDIMNLNHDQEDIYVKGDIADIAFKFTRLIMADGCTAANVYRGQ